MIVGYFDYAILIVLVCWNYYNWRKEVKFLDGCMVGIAVFGFVLPLISIAIEFKLYTKKGDPTFDAFTMAYTFLKFPLYWMMFILQSVVFGAQRVSKIYFGKNSNISNRSN